MSKSQKQQKLTFSKKLSIVDVITWTILSAALIIVMILSPQSAQYCVNVQTTITAAYVSLRLGYSTKAAIQNYKKISNSFSEMQSDYDDDESQG